MEALCTNSDQIHVEVTRSEKEQCCEFVIKSSNFSYVKWVLLTVFLNLAGFYFKLYAQNHQVLLILLAMLVIAFMAKLHFKVSRESLLVMSSLGVQITTTFMSGRRKSKFFSHNQIVDIVINEAVTMHKVIFYLCVLLKDTSKKQPFEVVPLFQHSWPRLCCLQKIYNGAWPLLHLKQHS